MAALQRYISKELTHFIGKDLTNEEDQYKLLIKIIKEGCLKSKIFNQDPPSDVITFQWDVGTPLVSENEVFNANMVCFCDIPIDDLEIHMKKYSHFGIGFNKKYLISKGVNPVFYIANNSILHDGKYRSDHFNTLPHTFDSFNNSLNNFCSASEDISGKANFLKKTWEEMEMFLVFNFFSYIKSFDDSKSDEDSKNYYMEREWRLLGILKFSINDIYRIIIPQKYSERFRKDIPEYFGQINFPHIDEK